MNSARIFAFATIAQIAFAAHELFLVFRDVVLLRQQRSVACFVRALFVLLFLVQDILCCPPPLLLALSNDVRFGRCCTTTSSRDIA